MKNSKLRVIFFGTPEDVTSVLDQLHKAFQVVTVITSPDAPVGRKYILTPSSIAKKAEELGIPALKPKKFNNETIEQLSNLSPDLFVVASFGHIIPKEILDIPKLGSLNIHPSKLPGYRGPSPIQNQILDGVTDSAITIMLMDEEVDHGPIVFQEEFILSQKDTFSTLHTKMFQKGAEIVVRILPDFVEGKIKPKEQNHEDATLTNHIEKQNGYFDINKSPAPEVLDKMIRAYYPWPTAWTKWNGKIVKLLPEGMIQIEGKGPVKLKDFLNGYPNFPLK
jgi:methionyl-tRNA formyltransferase